MSKSRNSYNYQKAHGEDLLYEMRIFGKAEQDKKIDVDLKRIEERRMRRMFKQQLMEF